MPTGGGLHSRIVAILKVGLPLVALGMLSALFLIQTGDGLEPGGLVFSEGDIADLGRGLTISNPTFTGATRGGDRFRFEAREVVPDAAPPTTAAIGDLVGRLEFESGGAVDLQATAGDLDIPAEALALSGDVRIETSDGYKVRAERVDLDLAAGTLEAGDTVATEGPFGTIDSASLRIVPADAQGETHRFLFGGGVRVLYEPPAETE
jgi:lipopolysaccharide export system protein LptC